MRGHGPRVYESGVDDGERYFTMELIDGASLRRTPAALRVRDRLVARGDEVYEALWG